MAAVPSDYPQRLAARGLTVHCFGDWRGLGGSSDHRAIALHHTASSPSTRPEDDAAYCHHGSGDAPLYNVLIDRNGEAWVIASDKSNNAGNISSVALTEVHQGRANSVSAAERGLSDDTSSNSSLFGISAQNNGCGEPWSSALVDGIVQASIATMECLGLAHAGFVTQHRVLTARKVDNGGDACPYDFQALITQAMGRGPMEVEEMWVIERTLYPGDDVSIGLPFERKSASHTLFADRADAELWGAQLIKQSDAIGLWGGGAQWEMSVPMTWGVADAIRPEAMGVRMQNRSRDAVVTLTLSGT